MNYTETTPKNSVNLLVLFYILSFEIIGTNSRYSTMWRLSSDRTRIIEGEVNQQKPPKCVRENAQLTVPKDLFDIITNTERQGSSWVKSKEHAYCFGCEKNFTKSKKNLSNTNGTKHQSDPELSCGKPANFTFYDNLIGVMNRSNYPITVDPEALKELLTKYQTKFGIKLDLDDVEKKLRQLQKEKPIAINTLHQMGNFWRMKGNPRKAVECFRKALSISPQNPDILLSLAKILFNLEYLDDALYLTRQSLEVLPSKYSAWQQYFTLGEIYKAYGHYYEASVHFRHTLDLSPNYEPALKLLKEIEDQPISPWQPYTYFIIGLLVIGVLVFISWDKNLGTRKSRKHFNKNIKGFCWSGRKCRKLAT